MEIRTIGRIRRYLKSVRTWRKYGDLTKYHLQGRHKVTVGEATYGIPEICEYDDFASVRIGSYCSIAHGVKILRGGNHDIRRVSSFPFPGRSRWFPAAPEIASNMRHGDVIIEDCRQENKNTNKI